MTTPSETSPSPSAAPPKSALPQKPVPAAEAVKAKVLYRDPKTGERSSTPPAKKG